MTFGPATTAFRAAAESDDGFFNAFRTTFVSRRYPSFVVIDEAVRIDGVVPTRKQLNPIVHSTEPDAAPSRRRWQQLRYRLPVPRNDDLCTLLHRTNELR